MRRVLSAVILVSLLPLNNAAAQGRMTLTDFLDLARRQNLDLKIEQAKSDAAQSKAIGVAIPPPMLSVSQMKAIDGSQANGFEVSQSIPFPTKLVGDRSARKRVAPRSWWRLEI